jgi:hypothetical protein
VDYLSGEFIEMTRNSKRIPRSLLQGNLQSTHDAQGQVWHQIEQQYTYFKQRHAAIVKGIEPINRYFKPFAVYTVHPVVSHNEKYKPPQQHDPVYHDAPGQHIANDFKGHYFSSFCWRF